MFPYRRMPWPITALYIFAVVNMLTLFGITIVHADVIVLNSKNVTKDVFSDYPAEFSPLLPRNGIQGKLVLAFPYEDACSELRPPPPTNGTDYFVLAKRYGCTFDTKAMNAEIKGYKAVIVYNTDSDDFSSFGYTKESIDIPTVLIASKDGEVLRDKYLYTTEYKICITSGKPFNLNNYLFPFAVVIAVCFVIMCIFSIVKCYRDRQRSRANRLPTKQLKKIPIKKFRKGDDYDVCAICLDEYKEGEKLRVLPCTHAYHAKCIDPWLTNNKRTCPVCKRKVFVGENGDSDEESESESEPSGSSESTPLLSNRPSRGNTNYGFNRSLLSRSEEAAQRQSENNQTEQNGSEVLPSTSMPEEEVVVTIVPPLHSVNGDELPENAGAAGMLDSRESQKRSKKSKNRDLVV